MGYSAVTVLRIIGIARSTYYNKMNSEPVKRSYATVGRKAPGFSYKFDGSKVSDLYIQKCIIEIKSDKTDSPYGYKKVTAQLRRNYSIRINRKKVRRLMKNLNLLDPKRNKRRKKVSRVCESRTVTKSNQLWQMDIKYAFIAGTKQTAYITSIIDVFDREIVSCSIDLSATGQVAKRVMLQALYNRGLNNNPNGLVLRTDNGSQFISGTFEEACITEKVTHERIPVRSPNYNAYIESYHRYLQDECLTGNLYWNMNHICNDVYDFVYRYNNRRIHSSIGYIPPHEYYIKNIHAA